MFTWIRRRSDGDGNWHLKPDQPTTQPPYAPGSHGVTVAACGATFALPEEVRKWIGDEPPPAGDRCPECHAVYERMIEQLASGARVGAG